MILESSTGKKLGQIYEDELHSADGGIAINDYDTGLFFEKLMKGHLIGEESLAQYFPESNFTYVLLVNSASYDDEAYRVNIYDACMDLMF